MSYTYGVLCICTSIFVNVKVKGEKFVLETIDESIGKELSCYDTISAEKLSSQGFFLADRLLNVRIVLKQFTKTMSKKRFRTEVGNMDENIIYNIAIEAFTTDRRFHLHRHYDQGSANKVIQLYVTDSLEKHDTCIYCHYKDKAIGFLLIRTIETGGFIKLAAVLPKYQGTGAALELYEAAVLYSQTQGWRNLSGKISAANTAVMNIYALFGATFYEAVDLYLYGGN